MHDLFRFSPAAARRCRAAAGAFGLACAAGSLQAAGPEPQPTQGGVVEAAPPALPARTKGVARTDIPARAGRAAAPDPLELVRERIAARIGARLAPAGGAESGLLRVTARTPAEGPGPALSAPRPAPQRQPAAASHWTYEGASGPQAWARLSPEFAQCAKGRRQSPIDIHGGLKVQLEAIGFDYKPGAFRVVDTGHTVEVQVASGSTLEVMGRRYELQQFHFHRPSEERVDGKAFEMVVHLVHKDPQGRLAVVAVLVERGSAQPVLQSVWNNLPLEKGDAVAVRSALDPAGLLPVERGYYAYMGSLTTPPCSEGVLWLVMKTPVQVAAQQIDIFARLYPMNARPIQAASGRLIKESE